MRLHSVKHRCGHEARYRLGGSRTVVEHHLHELEQSPCTPCADAAASGREHIYLGRGARVVALPQPPALEAERAPARRQRRRGAA